MPVKQKSLSVRYNINTGLIISPSELISQYLFGTPLKDRNGNELSQQTIRNYIVSATDQLQNYLGTLFKKQVFEETLQFSREDYYNWSYLKTTYHVVCPLLLEGYLNTTKQVTYPKEWLSSRKTTDGQTYHRNMYIVPAGNATSITQAQLFTGMIPNLNYLGLAMIPNYWTTRYVTGFDKIPPILIEIVAKLASINILRVVTDLILNPGIGSFSLGIDGLSQSVSSKGYDARIKGYLDDLNNRLLPNTRDQFKGYTFSVC